MAQLRHIKIMWKLLVRKQSKHLKKLLRINWHSDAAIFVLIIGAAFSFYKSQKTSSYSVEDSKPYVQKTQQEAVKPFLLASDDETSKKLIVRAQRVAKGGHNKFETVSNSLSRVNSLFECIESQDCEGYSSDYDNGDVYDTQLAVEVKYELYRVLNEDRISQAELEEFVKQRILGADDHIKEAGIHILSKSPKSYENLNVILQALGESSSADLFSQGMTVIKPYLDSPSNRAKIDEMLMNKLREKNLSTSLEITQNIYGFISPENHDSYKILLNTMSKSSKPHKLLGTNLKEFERMQNGG